MSILVFLRDNAPWLAAGVLLTFLSSFGQTYFISVFAGEIREVFVLSHGQWGGIYTMGTTASALAMVWAGGLTDRFRVRVLAPLVLVSHLAVVAMARWFIASRGRALSIASLGNAVGESLLPVIFVSLLIVYDWRMLWVVAAMIAIMGIPLVLMLLRRERTPQSWAESSQSVGMGGVQWTRGQTLRHFLFWFMVPALLGPSAFNTAFFFHQVHIAEVKRVAHVEFVAMFPIYTVVVIGSMFLAGFALDRFGTGRVLPFIQLPAIIGFALFSVSDEPLMLLTGFIFLALTTGANSIVPNAFWAEFYGTANIGRIKAMATAIMVLGTAMGPGITGLALDLGLGIETQFVLIAGYFGFSTLTMTIGVARARPALARAS